MALQSEQLAREAAQNRAELSGLLRELRERMTPGQVLDDITDYVRDGGAGEFVHNLGVQVRREPLPVALIGSGIAWLMWSSARGSRTGPTESAAGERMSDAAQGVSECDSAGLRASAEAADRVAAGMSSTTTSAYDATAETASRVAEGTSDAASQAMRSIRGAASSLRTAAVSASSTGAGAASSLGRSLAELFREQPLVLGGIGLAIGAALGVAFPETTAEDRLMGDASDRLKGEAGRVAREQYEQAKGAAKSGVRKATDAVAQAYESTANERDSKDAGRSGQPVGGDATPTPVALGIAPVDAEAAAGPGTE
jgi:hypothetical protein